jgi:hypothetical protein
LEYLKDKDDKEILNMLPNLLRNLHFDVIDRTRATVIEKEEVDFKIDDVIKEDMKEKKE